jgi:uncharacterized membrane protein YvbJ
MRNEMEIRKRLKELEKIVFCNKCGELGIIEFGLVKCPKCEKSLNCKWHDLAEYKTLKWVLEDEKRIDRDFLVAIFLIIIAIIQFLIIHFLIKIGG